MANVKIQNDFSIWNGTKGKPPRLPFKQIKNHILGEKYDLSLAFVSEKESRLANKKYRGKDSSANVLSFSFSKTSGEILICPRKAREDMGRFNMDYRSFVALLFIHGLLHLKGMSHGSKMEDIEKKTLSRFL